MLGIIETVALSVAGLTLIMAFIYIFCAYRRSAKVQLILKSITSFCFLLTGILCASTVPLHAITASFIVIGMFLCFLGDITMSFRNVLVRFHDRFLALAMPLFAAAHIFYLMAFFGLLPLHIAMMGLGIGLAGVSISVCLRAKFDFRNLYFPVMVFAIIISIMFAQTVYMAMLLEQSVYKWLIFSGGLLFVFSNIGLGITYFKKKSPVFLSGVSTTFYYSAQILFALSMLFMA